MIDFNSLEIEKAWRRQRLNIYLNLYFYLSEHQELLKDEKIQIIYKDVSKVLLQYTKFHMSTDKNWVCPKWKVNEKESNAIIEFLKLNLLNI